MTAVFTAPAAAAQAAYVSELTGSSDEHSAADTASGCGYDR